MSQAPTPKVSVVILNYNGAPWLERCFQSLASQTIYQNTEVIVADNKSTDGSDHFAEDWINRSAKGRFVQNGANLGYCEGNNRGAAVARGEFLFFLNNDTWLEQNCLELLVNEVSRTKAAAATPLVLDYESDQFQSIGSPGLDLFGFSCSMPPVQETTPIFAACGCSHFIRRSVFEKVGGFDPELFMYADETDLSWRVQIAGHSIIAVPKARLHHRRGALGSALSRISEPAAERKRYLANRNGLLLVLKNAQHVLLLLLLPQVCILAAESLVSLCLVRSWGFVWRAYILAAVDAARAWKYTCMLRNRVRMYRRRSDFAMLRFLRLKPSRFEEGSKLIKTLFEAGRSTG